MKFRCKLGIHRWWYKNRISPTYDLSRECFDCGKQQIHIFIDMCYKWRTHIVSNK